MNPSGCPPPHRGPSPGIHVDPQLTAVAVTAHQTLPSFTKVWQPVLFKSQQPSLSCKNSSGLEVETTQRSQTEVGTPEVHGRKGVPLPLKSPSHLDPPSFLSI